MKAHTIETIANDDRRFLFQNYGDRLPVCFTGGDASYLTDVNNRRFIDFFSGIAVSSLGYGNKALANALHKQVDRLLHTSNWYFNLEQIEAAGLISRYAFPGKTLFTNSGTEANEGALKLARRYGKSLSPDRFQVISFSGSFHGRTFGAMSATGQEKIRKGFDPLLPGFIFLPFNDFESLRGELDSNAGVCAVITELIQGEGGIKLIDRDFITKTQALCREKGVLLIIDEVQTGIGRTGRFCASEHFNVSPDIITFAKGLGGGVPIGAIHARPHIADRLEKGSHGSTFGGNHLACAAAAAVMKEIGKKGFLDQVLRKGDYIMGRLNKLKNTHPHIVEVRGLGLHIGVELDRPGGTLPLKGLERGLVINCTSEKVIRIMPPLNIGMKTIREGMDILEALLIEAGKD